MTADRLDDDQVGQRLAQVLEAEANTIEVGDAWDAIASRLVVSEWPSARLGPVSATRRRRRVLGAVAAGLGVAAAIVLAVVLGWRPAAVTPAPVAPATTSVPRYDASIPTLVVYRTTAGEYPPQGAAPATFTITPERMRTDSPDVGRAALEAMFDTGPVQPGNVNWLEQKIVQEIDITSVTVSGGLIRVDLYAFSSQVFPEPEAHVMAQAWVRTLQDTLGVRDDVLVTLRGQPFWLYYAIDTTKPLTRDESVRVVRPDGFDSPRHGDVVPSTFVLLGSATAGPGQPAHVQIVDLDTGAIAYEQEVLGPADRAAPVDFEPLLTLEPGRYRATLSGHGTVDGIRDITFTVVS
ncbi:MAG TPA: hypothetical protein VEX66_13700 [Microlunatus sp.]|nr:hypothetical protein [Microlunatus sp.]